MFGFKLLVSCVVVVVMFGAMGTNGEETNGIGCNNVDSAYGLNYCYDDWVSIHTEGESIKFVCVSDYRLAEYIYNTSDCSDDVIATYYYGVNSTSSWFYNDEFQCNATEDCEFAAIEWYIRGNDCDLSSRSISQDEYLIDVCSPAQYTSDDYESYIASCDSSSITVVEYASSDCSGDPSNTTEYTASGNFFYDEAAYCSNDGGYGECDNGVMSKYFLNLIFISIVALYSLFF